MVAPNEKVNFTKKTLETLPLPPSGKRYIYKDERERGLILRVTSAELKDVSAL